MQVAYRASIVLLSGLICLLGIVLAVTTLAGGATPLSTRFVVGAGLALLGAGRLLLAVRAPRRPYRT